MIAGSEPLERRNHAPKLYVLCQQFKIFTNKKKLQHCPELKKVYINEDLTVLRLKLLQYVKNIDNVKSAVTRKGKIHCVMKNGKKMTVDNPDDLFHLGVTDIDYGEFGFPIL